MKMKLKGKDVKGFNYQPGYASCTLETWRNFDFDRICFELLEYVKPIETEWLRRIYENCKKFGATQALGIGNLCFISRDASLREGHGIVNNYQNQPADAEK